MEVCNSGHEEIVHVEAWNKCPLCAALSRVSELEAEVDELNSKISDMETEIESLPANGER